MRRDVLVDGGTLGLWLSGREELRARPATRALCGMSVHFQCEYNVIY